MATNKTSAAEAKTSATESTTTVDKESAPVNELKEKKDIPYPGYTLMEVLPFAGKILSDLGVGAYHSKEELVKYRLRK